MNNATVLCCQNLHKYFQQGQHRVDVLSDVNFSVAQGERVAIIGNSGAGKSTLLQLLGGLDKPNAGEVIVADQVLSRTADAERGRLRNRLLGFIYQFHHLLPEFSALENVAMPLRIRGIAAASAMQQAQALLERVGLAERITHRPAQLSGGERQRAAVARALVTKPACVLADEPTGNLDRHNAEQVFNLMLDMNQEQHTSLVMVTHDHQLAQRMDSIWLLQDGVLSKQPTGASQSSSSPAGGGDAPRQ